MYYFVDYVVCFLKKNVYIYIFFFLERERETACYFYACTHTTFCGSVRMETQPRELSPPFRLLPPTFPVTRVDELRHILRLKRRFILRDLQQVNLSTGAQM